MLHYHYFFQIVKALVLELLGIQHATTYVLGLCPSWLIKASWEDLCSFAIGDHQSLP